MASPTVRIDSGPISANDSPSDVPREKWRDLMSARRYFLQVHLSYDCRCLVEFVEDANQMYEALGFVDADEMIREGYGLEPDEIAIAVRWLELNPPIEPISLDQVKKLAAKNQAINANALDLKPVGSNQHSEGFGTRNNDTKPSDLNDATYAIRRLRKDRPNIHARVLAGELTAHAGMIEAGFRKKRPSRRKSALEKILKLLPMLTADERVRLCEYLNERSEAA